MSDSILTEGDLKLVEQFAESMNPQEACNWFGIHYKDLLPADKENFDFAFNRGRANIKFFAMNKLKESCAGKQGLQASLAILSRFGEEWEHSAEMTDVKSFKVVLD